MISKRLIYPCYCKSIAKQVCNAELEVFVGAEKRLKNRMIFTRLSDEAAVCNRTHVTKSVDKKGCTASDAQLAMCDLSDDYEPEINMSALPVC